MADPTKDAADWLSAQDPNWRARSAKPVAPPVPAKPMMPPPMGGAMSSDDVDNTATGWLQKRFAQPAGADNSSMGARLGAALKGLMGR